MVITIFLIKKGVKMNKSKTKSKSLKRNLEKKDDLKKYTLRKIESLSWRMGKKNYSSREDIYDR